MSPPWMPLYVADYLADTSHLGAAEHGAYLLLIMQYWQKGSLPDDDRQLARIARMSDRAWAAARPVLQGFFVDGWRHARIEKELAKSAEKNDRRVAAGKEGGKASAELRRRQQQKGSNASSNAGGNGSSNAQASSSQPDTDTSLRSASVGAPRKTRSVRTAIVEGAQPAPGDEDHAKRVGMTPDVFRFEWGRFRDHHLKVGSTFANWPAAWRTWCANWLERGGSRQARAGPPPQRGRTVAEMAAMNLDEPDIFDDQRSDPRHDAPEGPGPADEARSGFAGRLSEPAARAARRGAFIDH